MTSALLRNDGPAPSDLREGPRTPSDEPDTAALATADAGPQPQGPGRAPNLPRPRRLSGLAGPYALIFSRELQAYFVTPIAAVVLVAFLALAAAITFYVGDFFGRDRADLQPFFAFHPWLFAVFSPALGMRLWAEERRTGTFELLMTLPVSTTAAVIGKFMAAWAFCGLALALTVPLWVTVNILGRPDNAVIVSSYLGSLLVAGGFLAVSAMMSALTRNQVVAFISAAALCVLLLLLGLDSVRGVVDVALPSIGQWVADSVSVSSHYAQFTRGILDLRSLIFFVSLMVFALAANAAIIDLKRQ